MSIPYRVVVVVVVALGLPATALATWPSPQRVTLGSNARISSSDVAVNGRGDVAIGFAATTGSGDAQRAAVRVVTVAADGTRTRRTLWTGAGGAGDVTVGIDRRGEASIAWLAGGGLGRAYGPLRGRWRPARTVAGTFAAPKLAVAPNGDVLLAWGAERRTRTRIEQFSMVSWRRYGAPFGRPTRLAAPSFSLGDFVVPQHLLPVFDGRSAAYLSNPCSGTIRVAAPGRRRFGRPVTLLLGSVIGLSLSVTDQGNGSISFAAGGCTGGAAQGDTSGPLMAGAILDGVVSGTSAVPNAYRVLDTHTVAVHGAPGYLTWRDESLVTFMARTSNGYPQLPGVPIDGPAPVAADWSGDLVIGPVQAVPPPSATVGTPAVRPIDGGPDQPAPQQGADIAVATPGRRIAAFWTVTDASLRPFAVAWSVWRP